MTCSFLKLPEHLKTHWKKWVENSNEKQAIMINQAAYDELRQYFAPARRSSAHVQATQPVALNQQIHHSHTVQSAVDKNEIDAWHVRLLLDHHRVEQSAIQYNYGDGQYTPGHGTTSKPSVTAKGKKRALPDDAEPGPAIKKRAPRTCVSCRRAECPGKWKPNDCTKKKGYVLTELPLAALVMK